MTRSLLAGACGLALILMPAAVRACADATPAGSRLNGRKAGDRPGHRAAADAADDDSRRLSRSRAAQLTITQPEQDGEKVLAYDGKQLASNYDVFFDKIVKVGGVKVALFDVGDGGNQCGPATVIVWKPEGGEIQSTTVEQDECGAPPAAVSDNAIYFVPYLLPGASKPALQWSPTDGLTISGNLDLHAGTRHRLERSSIRRSTTTSSTPSTTRPSTRLAKTLLGKDMPDMATSLLVGGGTEKTAVRRLLRQRLRAA